MTNTKTPVNVVSETLEFFIEKNAIDRNSIVEGLQGIENEKYSKLKRYTNSYLTINSDTRGTLVTDNDILSVLQGTYLTVKEAKEISTTEVINYLKAKRDPSITTIRNSNIIFDTYSDLLNTGDFYDIDKATLEDSFKLGVLADITLLAHEKKIPLTTLEKSATTVKVNAPSMTKVSK